MYVQGRDALAAESAAAGSATIGAIPWRRSISGFGAASG
jgi:hypothetical protein